MFSHATLCLCRIIFFSSVIYGALLVGSSCYAETRYISDVLVIALRKDQNLQSEVIGYLKSAEPVSIISENNELAQVENREGIVGWVRKKFLVSDPPKAVIIEKLQQENADLKTKLKTLAQKQADNPPSTDHASSEHLQQITTLKQNAMQSKALMAEADRELANLVKEIASLRAKNQEIANQLQKVAKMKPGTKISTEVPYSQDNKQKKADSGGFPWPNKENIKWFLAGGGIMLFGFVVGFFSRRKKAYYY